MPSPLGYWQPVGDDCCACDETLDCAVCDGGQSPETFTVRVENLGDAGCDAAAGGDFVVTQPAGPSFECWWYSVGFKLDYTGGGSANCQWIVRVQLPSASPCASASSRSVAVMLDADGTIRVCYRKNYRVYVVR